MKQPLKHCVQQHLNNKKLKTKQLSQLQALEIAHPRPHYFSLFSMLTVCSVLMVAFVTVYLYTSQTAFYSTVPIEQKIAEEVAANHLKLKPLEVSTNSLRGITSYFKQLNFAPINPAAISVSSQNLLGGRYCSIQGVTALQLRILNNKTNKVQSLYETNFDKEVFKNFPKTEAGNDFLTIYIKGLRVDMWVEKDLLFALIE